LTDELSNVLIVNLIPDGHNSADPNKQIKTVSQCSIFTGQIILQSISNNLDLFSCRFFQSHWDRNLPVPCFLMWNFSVFLYLWIKPICIRCVYNICYLLLYNLLSHSIRTIWYILLKINVIDIVSIFVLMFVMMTYIFIP